MVRSPKCAFARTKVLTGLLVAAIGLGGGMGSVAALAEPPKEAPEWAVVSRAMPTHLPPGGTGEIIVTAVNVGGAATGSEAVTVEDVLPADVHATAVSGFDTDLKKTQTLESEPAPEAVMNCQTSPQLSCEYGHSVLPGAQLRMAIQVEVEPGVSPVVENLARVSGGNAVHVAASNAKITVSGEPAHAGLDENSVLMAPSSHRAGAHANVTTGFAVNMTAPFTTAGDPKDIAFTLPPGFVGNTTGLPRCSAARVVNADCPADTIVGVATVEFHDVFFPEIYVLPVVSITPSPGEPAAFMFSISGLTPTRLDTSVLSNGNDAVRVSAADIEGTEPVYSAFVTVWGVPGEHEGPGPIPIAEDFSAGVESVGAADPGVSQIPLLSNATQCATSLMGVAETDSWRKPGVWQRQELPVGTLTGCLEVPFSSSFTFLPDTLEAGAPAGYEFDLRVPQQNAAGTLASADVKNVQVTLPEGIVVNPSAGLGSRGVRRKPVLRAGTPEPASGPTGGMPASVKGGRRMGQDARFGRSARRRRVPRRTGMSSVQRGRRR